MRTLKQYFYARRYRTILPTLLLIVLYAVYSLGKLSYTREELSHPFEEGRGKSLCVGFLIIVVLVCAFHLVMMVRDTRIAKTRLLLLPQRRATQLWLDMLWLMVVLLLIILLFYGSYRAGFYAFLRMQAEQQSIHYTQTGSLLSSLWQLSITSFLFPYGGAVSARTILVVYSLASGICVLSTFLAFDEQITKGIWCSLAGTLILSILFLYFVQEIIAMVWLFIICSVWLKQACKCWNYEEGRQKSC